jgi:hypothetical protein
VKNTTAAFVLMLSLWSESAWAKFCFQPTAPMAILRKPTLPYCAASRSCTESDVRMYRLEIDEYYGRLKRYAADLDNFIIEANNYIKCMSDLD